jgi:hypothetical protein
MSPRPWGQTPPHPRTVAKLADEERREAIALRDEALAAMRAELDAKLIAARLRPLTPRTPEDWASRAERHRSVLAAASDTPIAYDEDPGTGDRLADPGRLVELARV